MKTAKLEVIKSPYTDGYAIAWDGQTIASGCVAAFLNEVATGAKNRSYFFKYLQEATQPGSRDHTIHSGNGLNVMVVEKFVFFDHDHFENKKALIRLDVLMELVEWVEQLEALGFPKVQTGHQRYEFLYVSDGPDAEEEFRISSGFQGDTAWG